MPVANFAVVHEGPVLPSKGMTIASVDSRARGGANMGKKQLRANMRSQRAKVTVVPSGKDVFKKSRRCALVVPSNTKAVAIGDPSRLSGRKALTHNGMGLMKDQVFKVNLRTRVSNPSAHDDLG
jgi:hypothetical protein